MKRLLGKISSALALVMVIGGINAHGNPPVNLKISEDKLLRKNFFSVDVSFVSGGTGTYNLVYSLNNKFRQIITDIQMPYVFVLNLNGVNAGTYQLKVELEDKNNPVMESNSVTVITK